jgi:hypothetical protein
MTKIRIDDLPASTEVEKDELKQVTGGSWWGKIISFLSTDCYDIPGDSSLEGDYSETCYDMSTGEWYQK